MIGLLKQVRSINKRLKAFEGGFVTDEGLPQRPWYRSRTVAPGRLLGALDPFAPFGLLGAGGRLTFYLSFLSCVAGYGATTLPALTESLTLDKNTTEAAIEVQKLVDIFGAVAEGLKA